LSICNLLAAIRTGGWFAGCSPFMAAAEWKVNQRNYELNFEYLKRITERLNREDAPQLIQNRGWCGGAISKHARDLKLKFCGGVKPEFGRSDS
jgi:hypothetical protein